MTHVGGHYRPNLGSRSQRGVTTAEYVVLAAVLVLGLVAGLALFRRQVDAAAASEGEALEEIARGGIAPRRDRDGEGAPRPSPAAPDVSEVSGAPELRVLAVTRSRGGGPPGGPTGRGGPETFDVLPEDTLRPLASRLEGPALFINDNPETFRRPGVLGSTIGPVPGRGDTTHDFVGRGRLFALAQNGTG